MKENKNIIINLLIITMFIIVIITICPKEMQNDTFWSIKVGERIVNEGVFGLDNFSIHEDLYYVAHHFLTDVLIYIIYTFSGFSGLYVLEVVLALILAGMLYLLNKEICKSTVIATSITFVQIWIMQMYISVRAQMISFILFTLEILLLEKYLKQKKKGYIFALSVIPIILANFHMGTVPFFFIILGVYILSLIKIKIPLLKTVNQTDKERIKELLLVFFIGIATIFINPYFIDGVVYPFKTFGNDFINSTIQEFKPLSIALDGGWSILYVAIVILILIFSREKIRIKDFLLIFGTLFMSCMAIRYVSLFVICSSVISGYIKYVVNCFNLKKEDIKTLKATAIVLLALITGAQLYSYIGNKESQYVSKKQYPIQAVEFLKKTINAQDRVFNYYDWGSYLMMNNMKVYIDSRCDLYTKEYSGVDIAQDHNKLMYCDKDYKKILDKYNITIVIIPVDTAFATLLEENKQFNKIYADDIAIVYRKI